MYIIITVILFVIHIMIDKIGNKKCKIEYPNDFKFDLPLMSGNGIGFTFFGSYGSDMISERAYYFFSIFFLPILPLGCYRISRGEYKNVNYKKAIQRYKIYCKDKWNFIELIDIYAFAFSILFLIGGILSMF